MALLKQMWIVLTVAYTRYLKIKGGVVVWVLTQRSPRTYTSFQGYSADIYVSKALTPLQIVRYMKHTCTLTKLHIVG